MSPATKRLQVDGVVLRGRVGVHPVGDLADLCEGRLHLGPLQGLLVEVHDGGAVCGGTDAGERGLELLPVIGAGAAVGDRVCDPARLHLFGKRVEFGPCDGDLVGLGLVHRALGEKQHVGAVDLQRQRDPLAAGLVQLAQGPGRPPSRSRRRRPGRRGSRSAAIFDQAAISGPLSCEQAGGSPAMICARSLFIISVVNPGTGECCQMPPFSSNFLPSAVMAAPSLPADHCEITVRRGFTAWALARRGAASRPAVPASMVRRLILSIGSFPPFWWSAQLTKPARLVHFQAPAVPCDKRFGLSRSGGSDRRPRPPRMRKSGAGNWEFARFNVCASPPLLLKLC